MKVERQTYANYHIMSLDYYEKIHGLIESYGGRVKDCQLMNNQGTFNDRLVMFYEMGKSQRTEFEKELHSI